MQTAWNKQLSAQSEMRGVAAGSSMSGGAAGLERRFSRPVPVERLRSWRLLDRPSRRFEGSRLSTHGAKRD